MMMLSREEDVAADYSLWVSLYSDHSATTTSKKEAALAAPASATNRDSSKTNFIVAICN